VVDASGKPTAGGAAIAQCRGSFPDFIVPATSIPSGYAGPWFTPEKSLPKALPTASSAPWLTHDFRNPSQVDDYLMALRRHVFGAAVLRSQMTAAQVKALKTAGEPTSKSWYPAPRMTYGDFTRPGVREAAFGMTRERMVGIGEVAGNTKAMHNFAVGYYNKSGAYALGKTWSTKIPGTDQADLAAGQFPVGTMVFKVLYSDAQPADFPTDILAGAPQANILIGNGTTTTVRLLQMDVAVRDPRATETGWVFATFAYDKDSTQSNPWLRMAPVGLMWGNDPTAALGQTITQSLFSGQAPAYANNHKGYGGRLNGPVDNPISSCLSCHSTAQSPTSASITFGTGCSDSQKLHWFRNLLGTEAFGRGATTNNACDVSPMSPAPTPLDYSLQLSQTVRTLPNTVNPCTYKSTAPPATGPMAVPTTSSLPEGETFDVTRQ
jgi:hypothetical protein